MAEETPASSAWDTARGRPAWTQERRDQVVFGFNATAATVPSGAVHHWVQAQCRRRPQAPALRQGSETRSYAELEARVQAIRAALLEAGLRPGQFVAVLLERTLDLPAALLAVLSCNAAYLPIDPEIPSARIAELLSDAEVSLVLASAALTPRLPAGATRVLCLENIPQAGASVEWPEVAADAPAYLIYTSGSTGKPKGVVVTHGGVSNFLASMAREPGLAPQDVLLAVTTVSFDIAVLELMLPLTVGACVVVATRELALDGDRLKAEIEAQHVNVMQATPATWRLLLAAEWQGSPSFRALCGGEPLPRALARQLLQHGVVLWNMYGPTETTVWSTVYRVREVDGEIPIGRPIANTQCYVLDAQGEPCAPGEVGELFIAGAGVARGYWKRPELTQERFREDPFVPDNRMYRTGDLARWREDGVLECLGRVDFQVKLRGYRIEVGEIEAQLNEHPAVADAVCGVRERSAEDPRLVAWLQLKPGQSLDVAGLREALGQRLPAYMLPQHFMVLPQLPRLLNGKLDRKQLPDPFEPASASLIQQPGTRLEQRLADIWRSVLGHNGPLDVQQRFFEIGGTSLLALQVLSRLRTVLGVRIPVTLFFAAPTLAQFAAALQARYGKEVDRWLNEGSAEPSAALAAPVSSSAAAAAPVVPRAAGVEDIAIVGMACRVPGADDVDAFWDMVIAGREGIRELSEAELDAAGVPHFERSQPSYVRRNGVLQDAYAFDAEFFGCSPREAELMDPQHRVLLECAWHALEHAGVPPGDALRVGVYVGVAHNHYFDRAVATHPQLRWGDPGFQTQLGADKDYAASRIAFKLNLRGPALALQTACSSSGVAMHLACQGLRAGDCDAALVGGARINMPDGGYLYVDGGPQSPDGRVRPFDARAAGMVLSSGVACLVLKRLSQAQADGDRIYAVIKGSAINNDGADKIAFTAPSEAGQLDVIRRALAVAGVPPETVGYIEAHGTGTAVGDPIEVAALARGYERAERIALGSVKGNVGHLDAGAGAIGAIKAALALHHQQLPPSIHCETPNPDCAFDSTPFFVNTALQPWPAQGLRRAALSSFGFGGTNFHAVLEQGPQQQSTPSPRSLQLLRLSARDEPALQRLAQRLGAYLQAHPELDLADVAFTLDVGRARLPCRTAVVAGSCEEAAQRLLSGVRGDAALSGAPRLVLMFPGQGVQYAGMGEALYREEPVFREALDQCAEVLQPLLQQDLRVLLYGAARDEADTRLRETALAQPAIFAVSYATARLCLSWGLQPAAMLGHSIGEFVAATLAGVFTLPDALRLVAERGRLMQSMPAGSMLAVRLSEAEVQPYLRDGVELACVNAPRMLVLSGPHDAIDALAATLDANGTGCSRLRTSHAFHSSMMAEAAERFAAVVAAVPRQAAQATLLSTLSGRAIGPQTMCDPQYWARQLREPVRFADAVAELLQTPGCVLLEVGPGRSLSSAVRQMLSSGTQARVVSTLPANAAEAGAVHTLLGAVGSLYAAGIEPDRDRFYAGEQRLKLGLPGYPFARTRYCLKPAVETGAVMPASEPASAVAATEAAPAPARTPASLPQRLLALLTELTGNHFDEADSGRSFVELGLDSLLLIQFTARIKSEFQVELRFRKLLEEYTSVERLAEALQDMGVAVPASAPEAQTEALGPVATGAQLIEAVSHWANPYTPPLPEARIGRDAQGNPAWFVPDPARPGQYLQLERSA